eukprot:scaffold6808_cov106-Isochrysis_galbana.AAC.3
MRARFSSGTGGRRFLERVGYFERPCPLTHPRHPCCRTRSRHFSQAPATPALPSPFHKYFIDPQTALLRVPLLALPSPHTYNSFPSPTAPPPPLFSPTHTHTLRLRRTSA